MSLSDLDAEPYSNLDEVKKIMLERVTNSIENTITRTQALANTLMHSPGAETEE
jgi:hypothetical protein